MTTMQAVHEGELLLDGEWVAAAQRGTIPVVDPSTREVIQHVARGTIEDINHAVESGQRAFKQWSRVSPTERGRILYRWAQLVSERREELAELEARDVGKSLRDARGMMMTVAHFLEYFAGAADKLTGVTLPSSSPDYLGYTLREPLGLCAVIIPWNVPSILMTGDVAPALAAGNTVLLKPAEDAPLAPMRIVELGLEAGLPPGVLNIVTGYGEEAGAALSSHPGVNHISFTGSPKTGALVMAAAAKNLVPVKLELGGKSPNIVLKDANLSRAVPAIVNSIVYNAGQACNAGSRLEVDASRKDELVDAVAKSMSAVSVGMWHENTDMGPLINELQYSRVLSYLQLGKEEGARVITGGEAAKEERLKRGFFVQPTVFDDVTPAMRIAREEIFGPVLSILQFRDEDEAIALANDNPYGLTAYIWTEDLGRAHRLASEVSAGQIKINHCRGGGVIGSPFAAYKRSGFAHAGGYAALHQFTREKAVSIYLGG